jgi:nucleotide-binding universal stress UspA family protein
MIKTILVPVTGSAADSAVFASALAIARPFAAHLDFLHVRVDPAAMAVGMAADGGGAAMVGGLVERLDEDADRHEARARQRFDEFCAGERLTIAEAPPGAAGRSAPGPTAQWVRQIGVEPYWVTEHGRAVDLIVIGRPADGEGVVPETIEAAVLDSGRPVLIPAATALTAPPETIVIAWKATREAAHAVSAALPFVALAKQILILTVAEDENLSSEEGNQLMQSLRWRGIEVEAHRLHPDGRSPAETLIDAAAGRRALLVMGGYGHSRLREWVFGGFTRHVLETAAPVPVLIAH